MASDCRGFCRPACLVSIGLPTNSPSLLEWWGWKSSANLSDSCQNWIDGAVCICDAAAINEDGRHAMRYWPIGMSSGSCRVLFCGKRGDTDKTGTRAVVFWVDMVLSPYFKPAAQIVSSGSILWRPIMRVKN